jgi:hypothetical protein
MHTWGNASPSREFSVVAIFKMRCKNKCIDAGSSLQDRSSNTPQESFGAAARHTGEFLQSGSIRRNLRNAHDAPGAPAGRRRPIPTVGREAPPGLTRALTEHVVPIILPILQNQ